MNSNSTTHDNIACTAGIPLGAVNYNINGMKDNIATQ